MSWRAFDVPILCRGADAMQQPLVKAFGLSHSRFLTPRRQRRSLASALRNYNQETETMMIAIARIARRCGINLNYVFDPLTAYHRRQPLIMRRSRRRSHVLRR